MKYYVYVKGNEKKYYSATISQAAKNLWVWCIDDVFVRKNGRCKSYDAALKEVRILLKRKLTVYHYV